MDEKSKYTTRYFIKSIVLLELLVGIVVFVIIGYIVSNIYFDFKIKDNLNKQIVYQTLLLESTKLFIAQHTDTTKLTYTDNKIFYDNHLLLDNVLEFDINKENNIITIDISLGNNIIQQWKIKQ